MERFRQPCRGIGAETQFVQDAVLVTWWRVCRHYITEVDGIKTSFGVLSDIVVVV